MTTKAGNYIIYIVGDKMETGTEKVCTRCGTLNNDKSLMCIRCGNSLEISEEKRRSIFKGKVRNEKLLGFIYIALFTVYLNLSVFYIGPWIANKVLGLSDIYVFEFYNNQMLTYVVLQTIFTIALFIINFIITYIILDIIFNKNFIKREKANSLCIFIYLYTTLSVALITYYKFNLNCDIMLEYLISFIAIFPYIRKKIFKRII